VKDYLVRWRIENEFCQYKGKEKSLEYSPICPIFLGQIKFQETLKEKHALFLHFKDPSFYNLTLI